MPTFEVLIIDEAQDLSDFLWIFARKLIERAKVVYVAGDDDQAIMINFGASPHAFLLLPTTEKDYPLPKSYRVPEEVMSYVRSGTLKYVEELPNRVDKDWGTADHQGDVSPLSERPIQDHNGSSINGLFEDFTVIDLILKISTSREADWLVMAPTRATGERFSTALLEQQPPIPHFYRNKPYPNLSDLNNCKIRIQTVHASKGDQAENVAIIAESFGDVIMLVKDPRLAYVALTRAKKSMYPRVLKEGLLPSMSGAGQKWRAVAARFNDMFPGQRDL
jgi:superfamily I DNA/RNA helicase